MFRTVQKNITLKTKLKDFNIKTILNNNKIVILIK